MSPRTSSFRTAAVGLSALALLTLTGCLPNVSMSPNLATPAATSAPAPRHTAAPAAAKVTRPSGDLDAGTLTRVLPAGDRKVVIDYWTDDPAGAWTAADTKTVQLSAHLEDDRGKQTVLVTRFVATADDGTTRTTVVEDRGEFAITPPFSYSTVMSVLPSAPTATQVTVYVQLELLIQTGATSDRYFRQTVLDKLVLPLIKETRK